MRRYSLTTRQNYRFGVSPVQMTAQALANEVAGMVVRGVVLHPNGTHQVVVQLQRPTDGDALDEIAEALGRYGLDVAQAYITEIATDALAGALLGGTGGALGGAATEDPWAAFLVAIIGIGVGAAIGSARERVVAQFGAHRAMPGAPWVFYPVDPPTQTAPAW